MYNLKVVKTDNKYTIPKENIKLFAMVMARQLKAKYKIKDDEQAIRYLKSIGIEVYE